MRSSWDILHEPVRVEHATSRQILGLVCQWVLEIEIGWTPVLPFHLRFTFHTDISKNGKMTNISHVTLHTTLLATTASPTPTSSRSLRTRRLAEAGGACIGNNSII
jgi:hypothetical protein